MLQQVTADEPLSSTSAAVSDLSHFQSLYWQVRWKHFVPKAQKIIHFHATRGSQERAHAEDDLQLGAEGFGLTHVGS